MDLKGPMMLVGSILSVAIPIFGTLVIWGCIYAFSPYVRRTFSRNVGWGSPDRSIRKLSLSLTPWAFMIVGFSCVTIAFLIELIGAIAISIIVSDTDIFNFLLLVSAGPIEEGAKWVVALAAFGTLQYFIGSRMGRDPVKDGMLVGMFVGCSFGLLESVGYLVIGFSDLLSHGFALSTVDPLAWRIVLGVLIHGMYTSIACVGIGRLRTTHFMGWTVLGLVMAIGLHSMNNGIQGFFLLILDLNSTGIFILVDVMQLALIAFGATALLYIWNMRRPSFGQGMGRRADIARAGI